MNIATLFNFVVDVASPKEALAKVVLAKKLVNYTPETHIVEVKYSGMGYNDYYGTLKFKPYDNVLINNKNQIVYQEMIFKDIRTLSVHIDIYKA